MSAKLGAYLFWEEPGIQLYCGDCREVLPLLRCPNTTYCLEACDGRCMGVDIIVTDPPYGMERFATDGKNYLDAVGPALRLAFGALKEGGSMFVFTSTAEVVKVALAVDQPLQRMFWMYKPADCILSTARMASEVRSHPVVRQGRASGLPRTPPVPP